MSFCFNLRLYTFEYVYSFFVFLKTIEDVWNPTHPLGMFIKKRKRFRVFLRRHEQSGLCPETHKRSFLKKAPLDSAKTLPMGSAKHYYLRRPKVAKFLTHFFQKVGTLATLTPLPTFFCNANKKSSLWENPIDCDFFI